MLARTDKSTKRTEIYNDSKSAVARYCFDLDIAARTAKVHLFDLLMGECVYIQNSSIAWHKASMSVRYLKDCRA